LRFAPRDLVVLFVQRKAARQHHKRAACVPREVVRGAAVEKSSNPAVAPRADDQQVDLGGELGQLFTRFAVRRVALDVLDTVEALQLVVDQSRRDLRPVGGDRFSVGDGLKRDHRQSANRGSVAFGQRTGDRERLVALGRSVVADTDIVKPVWHLGVTARRDGDCAG
jgi:hypothetical protein